MLNAKSNAAQCPVCYGSALSVSWLCTVSAAAVHKQQKAYLLETMRPSAL